MIDLRPAQPEPDDVRLLTSALVGLPVQYPSASFPALNVGDVDAGIETASPVLGLRPVRAGRLLVPKVPNPGSRTSSPSARASPTIANTPSTASLAAPLLSPVRAAKRSAISVLSIPSLLAVMLCRSAIPRWHIARFQTPTTTNSQLPRRPATPRRIRSVVADPPVSPHRSNSCISGPSRRGSARCAPPCARTPTVRSIRTPQPTPPAPCCVPRPAGTSSMRSGCARTPGSAPAPAARASLPPLPSGPTGPILTAPRRSTAVREEASLADRSSHRPAIRPASTSAGVRTRCAPRWLPPSSAPPAPPGACRA